MAFVPWTPADLTAGLELWLDAADASARTVASGVVSELQDKSGNNWHAQQADSSRRPGLTTINGQDALVFDGSNDFLDNAIAEIPLAERQFFVVLKVLTLEANSGIFSASAQPEADWSSDRGFAFTQTSPAGGLRNASANFGGGFGSGPAFEINTSTIDALETNAVMVRYNINTGEIWANAAVEGSDAGGAYLTRSRGGYAIGTRINKDGSRTADNLFSHFVLCEVVATSILSAPDTDKVWGYLAHKWGLQGKLPALHPYKTDPPGEDTGSFGQITGTVKIDGVGVERQLIGISYEPQLIGDEETPRRIVVGEATSAADGTYTLETPGFLDEVIVLALDNYGEMWRPNRAYTVGQRIRPTRGNETGYGYDVSIAGDSGSTEPEWWVPAGGSETGSIGTATAAAKPLWWSVAQAPILPTPSEAPEVPWTPANTTTALWLDFADRDSFTVVAEAYSLVNDKSGNDRDASQGTAANRPTRVTEGQNGLDFARFDGSNDILNLVAFAQSSGQHLFIFGDTTRLQTGYRAAIDRSAGSGSNMGSLFGVSPQNYKPCFYWNGNQRAVQATAVQRKCGIRWHFTAGTPSMALTQVDGDTAVSETFTASALTNWATIGGPGALPAVDIYEIVMLPASASAADIDRVWGYGMHRWGLDALLPSDFVYKDAPPIVE